MGERATRALAVALAALIGVIFIASLVAYAATDAWEWAELADVFGFGVWVSAFTVVGVIIVFQRPRNPVGWICIAFGGVWSIWMLVDSLIQFESGHPGTLARPDLLAALAAPLWVPGVGLIGYLLLLLPDGRLPSRRWRPVAWLLGATMALLTITELFKPGLLQEWGYENPIGIETMKPFSDSMPGRVLVITLVLCIIASAVSLVVRYRRSEGIERLQLKWIMASALLAAFAYALLFFWDGFPIQLVWAAIPIAIGLSMHRHRLYDIDRLISRTVSYALVIGSLFLVYSASVFLVSALPVQGGVEVAASTLAVAALFNPIRRRVQGAVDRRFNRSHYVTERVLDEFAATLRHRVDPDDVTSGWLGVVSNTMQPTSAGIWIRSG